MAIESEDGVERCERNERRKKIPPPHLMTVTRRGKGIGYGGYPEIMCVWLALNSALAPIKRAGEGGRAVGRWLPVARPRQPVTRY